MGLYDVLIIGAGVVGANIARLLSKYDLNILVLDKATDVSCGASKANSGIVHGGYVAKYGTLKAKLCIKGNSMYEQMNNELNFGYRKTGSLVLAFTDEEVKTIENQFNNGKKNGIEDLKIISHDEVLKLEPNVNSAVKAALYCKQVGVTSPYEFTIALMENAITNGVRLELDTLVHSIIKQDLLFKVNTNKGTFKSKYVINAAGVYSDVIAQMVGVNHFNIIPRRGQYILFDKGTGEKVNHVLFQTPTENGKGILVTSTYHGNLMIGPNAEEVSDRDDISTNKESLKAIIEKARKSVPRFNLNKIIRTFSGIRATPNTGDFIIEESSVKGFINVAGIESPGLTASPAIALMVRDILYDVGLPLNNKPNFNPYRSSIIKPKELTDEEVKARLFIDSCPDKIICRCERVTEGEIVDAIHRNIDINSPDAIKRRTRAGMGRCQSAFCENRVREIIAREKNLHLEEVPHKEEGSAFHRENRGLFIK